MTARDVSNLKGSGARGGFEKVLRVVGDTRRPILAENPLLPILAGQRPYVLDSFTFRLIAERDQRLAEAMRRAVLDQAFSAVILEFDPQSESGREFYSRYDFGQEFVGLIQTRYRFAAQTDAGYVYLAAEGGDCPSRLSFRSLRAPRTR
jgi:hypothetical protein